MKKSPDERPNELEELTLDELREREESLIFEARNTKVEMLDQKRQIYDLLHQTASSLRKLGAIAAAYPVVMAAIWQFEIEKLGPIEQSAIDSSALVMAVAAGAIGEKKRRAAIREARDTAAEAVTLSVEDPAVPTPLWATKALGIDR